MSVCLNMIVRNESFTIHRLLDSVREIVDEYVIVDTGSTDDTVERIKNHVIRGKVFFHAFENFGVSRTFALEQARQHSQCEYLLLLDADMEFVCTKPFSPLKADAYFIVQQNGGVVYENIRMIRRTLDVTCKGATHEYYDLPPECTVDHIGKETAFILDHGDGGCKADKFARDLRLLENDLSQHPRNARTLFYLGQTLFDTEQYAKAIPMYESRISLGGWVQEVFYSQFRICLCFLALHHFDEAESWAEKAYETSCSTGKPRAEPFYYMCKQYREHGHHDKAYLYFLRGHRIPKPEAKGCLFLEESVYDFLLLFEQSILWFYVHPSPSLLPMGVLLSLDLLDHPNVSGKLRKCVWSNLPFYVTPLSSLPIAEPPTRLHGNEFFDLQEKKWRYSTPGFLENGTVYTRLVNYFLGENGDYVPQEDKVATRLLVGNEVMHVTGNTTWHQPETTVLGLEDTRILETDDGMYTLSSSREYARSPGHISQVLGKIHVDKHVHEILAVIQSPFGETYEKNWVFAGSLDNVIYRWYPDIVIGRIDVLSETFCKKKSIPSPLSFEGMRGSTNGVFHQNLWWFVTHYVVGDKPRKYFHRIVALDADLTEIRHSSKPFVFESSSDIEYCLGFSFREHGNALFGYSVRDRLPRTMEIPFAAAYA